MQTPEEAIAYLQRLQEEVTHLTQRMQTYEAQIGRLLERQGSDERHATGVEVDLKQLNEQYTRLAGQVDTLKNDMNAHFKQELQPLEGRIADLEGRVDNHDLQLRSR